jgi:hypothetical protein
MTHKNENRPQPQPVAIQLSLPWGEDEMLFDTSSPQNKPTLKPKTAPFKFSRPE